jgi:hypothetical protein
MNLIWIFGLAKCTPFKRVFDKSVPGTCWDKTKLVHFQLFASCKVSDLSSDRALTKHPHRLLGSLGLRPRSPAMADPHGVDHEAT